MMPSSNLFFSLAGLFALTVQGRVEPPSLFEFKEIALNTLARHASEHQMRDLDTTHSSYSSLFDECGIVGGSSSSSTGAPSTSTPTWSTEEIYDCACNCDAWSLDFNASSLFCSYQTLTEATTACYSSDAVTTCESNCSGIGFFLAFDCTWAVLHALFYAFGACSSSDSLDSTDDSGCVELNSGSMFFSGDSTMDLLCDDRSSSPSPSSSSPSPSSSESTSSPSPFSSESPDNVSDSAFTTSPVSLVYVFIIAALAVFGLQ
eukprot:CAMPEP_0206397196 /NCGR_PEP_ID=MMETSP0294-20121207/23291_1 /ASSEMBLY_ACC=CAM_ASM_000327 /TAXON_ID=39354 /ORGANISM="Heterosigma akashiwo, Strain CCMP2393" /LENGTH=260 /DNA_ID=CAMNT_0053852181 /DNA_START=56 /DNA_END=838 /DNA_ORIENTATION=-